MFIGAAFFRRKQVIDRCQLYIFALLFNFQNLLRQILISLGHLAAGVMGIDAFPLGAGLLGTDRMGNFRAEYLDLAPRRYPGAGR